MEEFLGMMRPELLGLIPILAGMGVLLKRNGLVKDKYIPFVLIVASIVLAVVWIIAMSESVNVQTVFGAIFQGVLLATTTVGGHQCFKQVSKSDKDKPEEGQADDEDTGEE